MEEYDSEKTAEETTLHGENPDFIQEFIERKKLQNKVLQEIIDNITKSENKDKTNNNQ
jgi:hypothetical protein